MISEIAAIIIHLNQEGKEMALLQAKVNKYMRTKKLPHTLRDKVRTFLGSHYGDSSAALKEEEILGLLPEKIVSEIGAWTTRDMARLVPLLKEHSKNFSSRCCATEYSRWIHIHSYTRSPRCCSAIRTYIAFQDDIIFEQNTSGNEMFFICSGVVQIVSEGLRTARVVEIDVGDTVEVTKSGNGCGRVGLVVEEADFNGQVKVRFDSEMQIAADTSTLQ
jgi:hypothetical protein